MLRKAVFVAAMIGCLAAGCQDVPGEPVYKQARVQEEAASMKSPSVGMPAPDFTLPDQDNKPVSLHDLRGKWVVLYFYPQDDTPGCTCEATEFTDILGGLKGMNARVLAISGDAPEVHRIFVDRFKLGIDLLSDPKHEAMRQYGAWVDAQIGDKTYQRVIRSTFLIDPHGVIRYHWPEVIPKGHAERVREKLAMLQAAPAGGK